MLKSVSILTCKVSLLWHGAIACRGTLLWFCVPWCGNAQTYQHTIGMSALVLVVILFYTYAFICKVWYFFGTHSNQMICYWTYLCTFDLPVSGNMLFDNSHVALLMLIKRPPVMDRISIEVSNLCWVVNYNFSDKHHQNQLEL